jgi:membrane peptidoglycan carboxypeptidase
MNYGDPTNPATGRAHVPGPSGGAGYDAEDDGYGAADGGAHDGGYGRTPGRAPVGDSLRPGAFGVGAGPVKGAAGRASVGRASVGRTAVPPADDEFTGDEFGAASPTGRAAVPVNGVPTGRAAVRSSIPGMLDEPDIIENPDPVRRPPSAASKRESRLKQARRRNWIIGGLAAFIMLSGTIIVGGTYYFDAVALPKDFAQPESTTIYYSDGKTPMAKIGEENRTLIPFSDIPRYVQQAVVAAEDRSFYQNSGVDFRGIVRAAWNNFTGGERQGASTITQQYARNVADLKGITYSRKLREAVIAMKLSEQYKKDEIMTFYLNTVYFGRETYGIEAAAQAYFGKSTKQLTVEEGMVLAGMIKDPEGDGVHGSPYDPTKHPDTAKDRWDYIRKTMVDLGFVNQGQADAMKYPTTVRPRAANDPQTAAQFGLDRPTGLVVHHVMDELAHIKNADNTEGLRNERGQLNIKDGGYKIITTIDQKAQAAAEAAADETKQGSVMFGQPPNLRAALVAVEPGTGRVRAYYGAANGAGYDMAGWYADPVLSDGNPTGANHPPGSTFKIYTLGAALKKGASIDSYWDGSPVRDFPASGRSRQNRPPNPVTNSGSSCPGGCPLWYGLEQSMNTVFFAVGEWVTAAKVVDFARAAGIRSMWASVRDEQDPNKLVSKRIDLSAIKSGDQVAPKFFSTEVSIGQYGITVMDHANGVATIAARGFAAPEHFVQQVWKGATLKYQEKVNPTPIQGYTPQMADDEAWAMQQVIASGTARGEALSGGREAAGKTGTWELRPGTKDNAHAWFVGFTATDLAKQQRGLAAAVWVGNKQDEQKIVDKNGRPVQGAGLPGQVWKKFMDAALKGQKNVKFAEAQHVGDDQVGDGKSPMPSEPGNGGPGKGPGPKESCILPLLCPSPKPSGGGGGYPQPSQSRRL